MNLIRKHKPRQIEVKLAAHRLLDQIRIDLQFEPQYRRRERREPLDDRRQRARSVGENERHVRAARDGPGQEEVHHGARGVEEEFEHRIRVLREGDCPLGSGRMRDTRPRRVDEHRRVPALEFGEDGVEGGVPEVVAVVVRLQGDTVGVQLVERVGDLVEAAADVGKGQGGPEAELGGATRGEGGGVGVAGAGEGAAGGVVVGGEVRAGGGDADDGFGDGELLHQFEVGLFAPLLSGGALVQNAAVRKRQWRDEIGDGYRNRRHPIWLAMTCLLGGGAPEGWHEVRVRIDPL